MRHYRLPSPYVAPEHYSRMKECIRRRSVLGPWKKVYLEKLRAKDKPMSPKKTKKNDKSTQQEIKDTKPDHKQTILDKEKEIEELEKQLEELMHRKHLQFGLLKTILMDEARQKMMNSRVMMNQQGSPKP
ncbi:hypothetical protein THRCLA_21195 [Thraustotheca clavata]|uniref:Uncharacterized protein n=1 Tax=Thraustotheca clavata TaxID=74557 RepID=A0A1V9ZZ44_9STRA|nr:hypothetical protein THRCLA_21195 [Thraustotheca clavata]